MSKIADLCKIQNMTSRQKLLSSYIEGDDIVGNPFANNQRRTMPYMPVSEIIQGNNAGESYVYEFDKHSKYHFLMNSSLEVETPHLKIKDEYIGKFRMCWARNLGYNIVQDTEFLIDGSSLASFTRSTALEHANQFFYNGGTDSHNKRRLEQKSNGNTEELTEWTTDLPSFFIITEQPWFYSQGTILSFPLKRLYDGIYTTVSQNYRFRLKISELLRLQHCDEDWISDPSSSTDKKWTDIPFDEGSYAIEGLPRQGELPIPKLRCEFAKLGDETVEYLLNCSDSKTRNFIINNYVSHKSDDEYSFGDLTSLAIKNSNPTIALMWSVTNVSAQEKNEHSCALTSLGRNPVKSNTLSFFSDGDQYHFKDISTANCWRGPSTKRFPSSPSREGYMAWPFAISPGSLDADSTIEFQPDKNYSLKCRLHNKLPTERDDKFILEATTVELRMFSIDEDTTSTGRYKITIHF